MELNQSQMKLLGSHNLRGTINTISCIFQCYNCIYSLSGGLTFIVLGNYFSMCRIVASNVAFHSPDQIPPGRMLVLLLVQAVGLLISHVVSSQPFIHQANGQQVMVVSMQTLDRGNGVMLHVKGSCNIRDFRFHSFQCLHDTKDVSIICWGERSAC